MREEPAGGGGGGSGPGRRVTLEAIKTYLSQSELGRQAVKYFEDEHLLIDFSMSSGCWWDGKIKTIIIDRSYPLPRAALSFVHEVYHARAYRGGTTGNPKEQTKEQYLETMFDEEVQATIAAIKVRLELTEAGAPFVAPPNYFEYHQGRAAARKRLLKESPDASLEMQKEAEEQGGYDALMARYVSGEARGSRDGRPYLEIYGSAWDSANPGRA